MNAVLFRMQFCSQCTFVHNSLLFTTSPDLIQPCMASRPTSVYICHIMKVTLCFLSLYILYNPLPEIATDYRGMQAYKSVTIHDIFVPVATLIVKQEISSQNYIVRIILLNRVPVCACFGDPGAQYRQGNRARGAPNF